MIKDEELVSGAIIFIDVNHNPFQRIGKYLVNSNHRFCIIKVKSDDHILVCPTTTTDYKEKYDPDDIPSFLKVESWVEVKHWKEANQTKRCWIKTDQLAIIKKEHIHRSTGVLVKSDLKKVLTTFYGLNVKKELLEELDAFNCF